VIQKAKCLVAGVVIAFGCEAATQTGESNHADTPVIRSNSRVVQIDVTVKDNEGRTIRGLVACDFQVTDNGKRRDIPIFGAGEDKTPPSTSRPPAALPEGFLVTSCGPPFAPGAPRSF
jgi:hypothetical protein